MSSLIGDCKVRKSSRRRRIVSDRKKSSEDTNIYGTLAKNTIRTGRYSKNSEVNKIFGRQPKSCIKFDLNSVVETPVVQSTINDIDLSYLDFTIGEVFLEKWLLLHKINQDSRLGVSYLVHDGIRLEGILRAEPLSSIHNTVMNEAIFLEKQSLANKSYLFNVILDLKRVNEETQNGFVYIVTLFRCGPTLQQCLSFAEMRFDRPGISYGTVGRIAVDLLSVLENSFKSGFAFRNIHSGQFSFDVRSRRVYMHDRSDLIVSKERRNVLVFETTNMHWVGCPEHAPLDWHIRGKNSHMCEINCLEALFYLILDMLGILPWKRRNVNEIISLKKRWSANTELPPNSARIPEPMISFWLELCRARSIEISNLPMANGLILPNGPRGGARISFVDYKSLHAALESLYITLGGVRSWDEPYDFEMEVGKSPRELLVAKLVSTIDKVDHALGELEALELRTECRTSEDTQMKRETRQNSLFINNYIQKELVKEDEQNDEIIDDEG